MYLKRLELQGFKSFIDRTKISLEPGISCIVGPNGSGKSNVVDAVRWVLGEQSVKSLRGGKMEDIIFAGSKKRKPLGMAEVTIVLDNADAYLPLEYTEIAVTRRAYRSGESEYLINNQPCRLKDIYQLFVDSGISAHGFSLIGQGQVNQVVNAKPEERRQLIEEAAGIVKYRNRKKEAVRKLNDTEVNLQRLADIMGEIADRLPVLAEQSAAAQQYTSYQGEVKSLEINWAVRVLGDLQNKLRELTLGLEEEEKNLLTREIVYQKEEAALEERKLTLASFGEEISKMQAELYRFQSEKEKTESNLQLMMAKKNHLLENKEKIEQEIFSLQEKKEQSEKERNLHLTDAQNLEAEIGWQKAALLTEEGQKEGDSLSVEEAEIKLNEAKEKAFDLAQQATEAKNMWQNALQSGQRYEQIEKKLQEQQQNLIHLGKEIAAKTAFLEAEWDAKKTQKEENLQKLQHMADLLQQQNAEVQKIGEEETKARFFVHSLESKLQMLQELNKNYEGFYPGVKAVLKAKQNGNAICRNVYGVMAELLDMDTAYTMAIETALGSGMQNIVAANASTVKEIIAYLKQNRLGRATFLPLDTVQPQNNAALQKGLQEDGILGRASDLVRYPAEIEKAVVFLLGNILIAEDLHKAQAVAQKVGYRFRIVTLAGDMVNAGGSFTGGSRETASGNLLSRKQNLLQKQQELQEAQRRAQQLLQILQKARADFQVTEAKEQQIRQELQVLEMDKLALQKDLEQNKEAEATCKKQLQQVQIEWAEIKTVLMENSGQETALHNTYDDLAKQNEALATEISTLQEKLHYLKKRKEDEQEAFLQRKMELTRMQQELAGIHLFIEKQTAEEEIIANSLEEKQWDLAIAEAEIEKEEKEQKECQEQLLLLQKEIAEREEFFQQQKHGLLVENEELAQKEKWLKEEFQQITQLKEMNYQKNIKKTRLEADLQNETTNLYEKYALNYEEAVSYKDENLPDLSKKEMAARISGLKNKIETLGAVNLAAITEYEQVQERYDFLQKQNADLQEAKTTLYQVIQDMDAIMGKRFQETFRALSDEFHFTFQQLFGGGQASLLLTDPDHILETGVEISVQPPGKKVANYNLLSGGEKTMVGIALLFAILKIKPSPFCLLDEVDAALDEANVERFANYLSRFADKTQFLLISHRQGTMAIANALWGITMEEEGISKVVSVKLSEEQQAG